MATPTLVLITVIGTLLYLGLAVLGWGGLAAFFSHPALIALAIAVLVMSGVALFSSGNLSSGEREDRSNRWVIAVFAVIGLLMAYLPAYTDRKDFWTLDGDAIRWLGVVLFTIGGALRIYPVFVLGRRFQRVGRHPARTCAGHVRSLWRHPPSQLPRVAHQLLGLGLGLSLGSGRAAHGAHRPAAPRTDTCGRGAAALAVRRRV